MYRDSTALQGLTGGGAFESWLVDETFWEESNRKEVSDKIWTIIVNGLNIKGSLKFLILLPEDLEKVVRILLSYGVNVNV